MRKIYFLLIVVFSMTTVSYFAQPANDNCADAETVVFGTYDFTTLDATTDGPTHGDTNCPGFSFGDDNCHLDVWYNITAISDGFIQLSTCGMIDFDSRLVVYSSDASCTPVEDDLIACNDDGAGCPGFSSFLNFPVVAGETYLMRIGGYSSGDSGSGQFSVSEVIPPDPPVNNDCVDATASPIVTPADALLGEGWTMGSNENAASIVENPLCQPFGEFYDVWYTFNSGENEEIECNLEILTTDAAFYIELWEGDCSGAALPLDSGGVFTQTCFTPDETTLGSILLEGFSGDPTNYLLRVSTYVTGSLPGEFEIQLVGDDATTVGISEFEEIELTLFPNPNDGDFQISTGLNMNNAQVRILDLQGRQVHSQNANFVAETPISISLTNVNSGIYFIQIFNETEQLVRTEKFIKK